MKRFLKIFLSIIFCACSAVCALNLSLTQTAHAGSILNTNYSEYGLSRELFDVFLKIYNQVRGSSLTFYESDFFNLTSGKFENEKGDSADSAILTDLRNGVLNLTTGENGYDCLKNVNPIRNIGDLSFMEFDGVKKIILNDNSLSSIGESNLIGFEDLEEVEIKNNRLTSFKLNNVYFGKIKTLDLSSNLLTNVDLSCVRSSAEVNLSKNRLSEISSISFPDVNLEKLDLSFNNLTGERDISHLTSTCHVRPIMLVQGLGKEKFCAGDIVTVFNNNETDHLVMSVSYRADSSYSEIGEICSTDGLGGFEVLYLPVGKIKYSLSWDYLSGGASPVNLIGNNINSLPQKPTYYTICEGQKSTQTTFQKDFDLIFDYEMSNNIPNKNTFLNDYKLEITSGSAKYNGTTLPLRNSQSYSLKAVAKFDGLESEALFVNASRENPSVLTAVIVIVCGIVIAAATAVMLTSFFRNGGQVAPLSDKELARIRRREGRKYGREYDFSQQVATESEEEVPAPNEADGEDDDSYLDLSDEE